MLLATCRFVAPVLELILGYHRAGQAEADGAPESADAALFMVDI